jgi:hypothetical protein
VLTIMNGTDSLPSWREGAASTAILDFIESVIKPGASFVPAAERIAAFDNDGTLWCEKPQYVEADFVVRRREEMTDADPAKAKEQPYKAVLENDRARLSSLLDHVPEVVKGVGEAYEGITVEAFEQLEDDA